MDGTAPAAPAIAQGLRNHLCLTAGATEATDGKQELFGEERLQNALNQEPDLSVYDLLPKIKGCIDRFVGEAEQFDDITMLGLKYRGGSVEISG